MRLRAACCGHEVRALSSNPGSPAPAVPRCPGLAAAVLSRQRLPQALPKGDGEGKPQQSRQTAKAA